jgi:vitamin B12 transporter
VFNQGPMRTFVSYGTAFKAPSLSERFETSVFNIGNPDLRPERSRSWEIGADWRVREWLGLGGSYYQTRITDLIEYDFAPRMNINVGAAEIDGAEAYVEATPTAWGFVRLAYAWTDARNGATGAPLARRPENTWRLETRISPTERASLALTWDFVGARTDVTYDGLGAFESGGGRAPGFALGALAAAYDITDHTALFARVDNLTDATYEQPAAFAGAARSVRVGMRASF